MVLCFSCQMDFSATPLTRPLGWLQAIVGAPEAIARIRKQGMPLLFVTNTTTKTAEGMSRYAEYAIITRACTCPAASLLNYRTSP
jgi:hypothetical protein